MKKEKEELPNIPNSSKSLSQEPFPRTQDVSLHAK